MLENADHAKIVHGPDKSVPKRDGSSGTSNVLQMSNIPSGTPGDFLLETHLLFRGEVNKVLIVQQSATASITYADPDNAAAAKMPLEGKEIFSGRGSLQNLLAGAA